MVKNVPSNHVERDRRSESRGPIELKIEYQRLDTFFVDYTRNISKGGTFLKTDRPLEVGTFFLFSLCLPEHKRVFKLKGEVVWINKPAKNPGLNSEDMGMGIKFVFENEQKHAQFREEVEALMVEAYGQGVLESLGQMS
jgi:type IV pilus assembly protein PilZ